MRDYMEQLLNGKSTARPSSHQCKSGQDTMKLQKKRLENQEVIQKKQELLTKLNKSQKQWSNNEQRASCLTLRNALNLIIEIIDNEHIEQVKNVYKQKFYVLKNRLIEREQICYLKNTESKKLNKNNYDNIKKTGIDEVVLQEKNINMNNLSLNWMIGLKNLLRTQIQLQIKVPEIFIESIKPKNRFLFFGPGSEIADLVKYWIAEIFQKIYTVSQDKFLQFPQKQAVIQFLFKSASSNLPSVIFLPQIDRLFNQNKQNYSTKKLTIQFIKHLSQINQQSNNVYIICTTNLPWILSPQIGKIFEQKIYIGLPKKEIQIIKNKMKDNIHTLNEKDFNKIASLCQNYSIEDIDILVRAALFQSIRRCQYNLKSNEYCKQIQNLSVSVKDFEAVLNNIKPSLSINELKKYEDYQKLFGKKQ